MASSTWDVLSLRCLQGFQEGPQKAVRRWSAGSQGGVGQKVGSGNTPEKGWPLAWKGLPKQRTQEDSGAGGTQALGRQRLTWRRGQRGWSGE